MAKALGVSAASTRKRRAAAKRAAITRKCRAAARRAEDAETPQRVEKQLPLENDGLRPARHGPHVGHGANDSKVFKPKRRARGGAMAGTSRRSGRTFHQKGDPPTRILQQPRPDVSQLTWRMHLNRTCTKEGRLRTVVVNDRSRRADGALHDHSDLEEVNVDVLMGRLERGSRIPNGPWSRTIRSGLSTTARQTALDLGTISGRCPLCWVRLPTCPASRRGQRLVARLRASDDRNARRIVVSACANDSQGTRGA